MFFVLSHSKRNKGGVSGEERRQSVRDTWKKDVPTSGPNKSVFKFVMDEPDDVTVQENAKYDDIIYLNHNKGGQGESFGEKLIIMSKWAIQNYDFQYLYRIDDDNYLCIDHILHDLNHLGNPSSVVWGWWITTKFGKNAAGYNPDLNTYGLNSPQIGSVCEKMSGGVCSDGGCRPDEMGIILSANLVHYYMKSPDQLATFPLMDVSIMNWISPLKVTYFVDNARFMRGNNGYGPEFNPVANGAVGGLEGFCANYISFHKAHPQVFYDIDKATKGAPSFEYAEPTIHENCVQNSLEYSKTWAEIASAKPEESVDDGTQRGTASLIDQSPFSDWGVITTIFTINDAVVFFAEKLSAGLVVVGDKKTNHAEWQEFARTHENVVYLSPEDQEKLPFSMVKSVPWNHFGRKSIGFLYAVSRGARRIFDFDDDNHLSIESFAVFEDMQITEIETDHHMYNPYPHFDPRLGAGDGQKVFSWPRGMPLQFINDKGTYEVNSKTGGGGLQYKDLAVVQSLANHDPDVDAVYRLTRELPLYFAEDKMIRVAPKKTFVPWNAQAVLVNKPAFWGLLLPVTVPGRVSDIWRSYITTRLLWETDYSIGFTSAVVTQYRNPHSYMDDFHDEMRLYTDTDELLETLAGWDSRAFSSLDDAYLAIVALLHEKGLLGEKDVELARAYVKDLNAMGYEWPEMMGTRMQTFVPKKAEIVDGRNGP
jgi:hypothetical protein